MLVATSANSHWRSLQPRGLSKVSTSGPCARHRQRRGTTRTTSSTYAGPSRSGEEGQGGGQRYGGGDEYGGQLDLKDKVVVVGAGIAGLATAAALKAKNIPCVVFEKNQKQREGGTAIALWQNAWVALEELGVAERLRSTHACLDRVELCAARGKVLKSFSFDECEANGEFRGVWRSELTDALSSKLDPKDIQYGLEITGARNTDAGIVELTTASGETIACKAVVGCDGIGSSICKSLDLPKPTYAGYSAVRGVAEFDKEIPFETNLVRQIFGEGVRAGMYPLSESSVYWFVCFNSDRDWVVRNRSKDADLRDALLSSYVARWNHDIRSVIEATPRASLVAGSISDRWMSPLQDVGRGKITCAGDALHPMTPNLGQGGCCALEDAIVLANKLGRLTCNDNGEMGSFEGALRDFEKSRLERCLPLTVRANVMGQLLQIDNEIVCSIRNLVVERVFNPKSFLDHTDFDCRTV